MPRNKQKGSSQKRQDEYNVQSLFKDPDEQSRTLDWLCHIVQNLDEKVDNLAAGNIALHFSRGPSSHPQPATGSASNYPETAVDSIQCFPILDARVHNRFARNYNSLAQDPSFVLMPLRDERNQMVSSFPRTLARLAFIYEDGELFEMLKSFHLSAGNLDGHRVFSEYVGVNYAYVLHTLSTHVFPHRVQLNEAREQRDRLRAAAVRYAVRPDSDQVAEIQSYNAHTRSHNAATLFTLRPLRDSLGLFLPGFPKDLWELFNPVYQSDITHLLSAFGLETTPNECERRWVEFIGVPWEWRKGWVQDELVFSWYFDG